MKVVVDTNILFSYFKEKSFTSKIISDGLFELISPDYAVLELEKYSELIMKKVKINKNQFNFILNDLKKKVNFVSEKGFKKFISSAERICPDLGDVPFFALCLKYGLPLWSNDSLLKSQKQVLVFSTSDLVDFIL